MSRFCVSIEEPKETQTATWIGKHVPISVSTSSINPSFLQQGFTELVIDFLVYYELLAEKSKLEMRRKFQDFEVAVNKRMRNIFGQLNERG